MTTMQQIADQMIAAYGEEAVGDSVRYGEWLSSHGLPSTDADIAAFDALLHESLEADPE